MTNETGVFCAEDGGELRLVTGFDGEPYSNPARPDFYRVRCDAGHDGGIDATKHPVIFEKMRRLPRPRLTLDPMHPGHAQLGLRS